MKFSIFSVPLGLAVFASALPAAELSVEETAGLTNLPEIDLDDLDFNTTSIEKRDVLCSPTGRESCNLNIRTWIPIASAGYQRVAYVYDYSCREIGYKALGATSGHHSMYSELPWTIELDVTGGGFNPTGYFWYAGRKTELSDQVCGHHGTQRSCRVAFRCD